MELKNCKRFIDPLRMDGLNRGYKDMQHWLEGRAGDKGHYAT